MSWSTDWFLLCHFYFTGIIGGILESFTFDSNEFKSHFSPCAQIASLAGTILVYDREINQLRVHHTVIDPADMALPSIWGWIITDQKPGCTMNSCFTWCNSSGDCQWLKTHHTCKTISKARKTLSHHVELFHCAFGDTDYKECVPVCNRKQLFIKPLLLAWSMAC